MKTGRTTNGLLLVIAIALSVIAMRPYFELAPVQAQTAGASAWYVEPGVQMLILPEGGQVLGKVAVDLRSGNIWGFPTNTANPYPVSTTLTGKAAVSHPFSLGRFAIEDTMKTR